jgi:hypothetical protein
VLRLLAPLVAAIVTLHASPACATPTARLVYSRTADAASCPDEGALRTAVAARVGYDPFFAWAKRTVIANLTRKDRAYVAKIDLVDEQGLDHGARALRTEGPCSDLLDTVALTIAIAIDPQSLTRAESPNPVPDPNAGPSAPARETPETATPPSPAPPPDSEPARPGPGPSGAPSAESAERPGARGDGASESGAPAVEAFLGAVVSDGVAPGPAPGVALGSALLWRWVSLGVDARIDAPAGETAPTGGSVSSSLVVGTLAPCARFGPWRVPLLACALVQAGSMQSGGSGVSERKTGSALWFASGGRLGAGIRLSSALELRARGDLVLDLARTSLVLDGARVWRADPVAGSLALDGVVHFR